MRDRFCNPHSATCTERSRSISNRKLTVLNVDDDDASRYAVSRILRQAGFEVIEAANGAETLRLVKGNPDLVILDIHMPDMSGFEVCRRIRADPATSLIPVLHLSATYLDSQSMVMGLDSGADGYLTEPVEPPVLIAYVKALLRIRQTEAELQAAARQWRTTFDAIGDAISLLDLQGMILRCNVAMTNLLGKPFDEIVGRTCWELVHSTSEPIEGCPIVRMRETRHRETLVLPIGDRWLEVAADPLLDQDGKLIGSVHIMSDITERVRAEEELRESQRFFKQIADATPNMMIYLYDLLEQRNVYVNQQIGKILGYTEEQIQQIGSRIIEILVHPDDLESVTEHMKEIMADKKGEIIENEYRMKNANGEWCWLLSRDIVFTRGADGLPKQNIGTALDITARKRAEEEIRQSYVKLQRALEGTVNVLGSAIEMRDPYTAGHQRGVTQLTCVIANEMGLSEEQIEGIRMAGLIHDIGKISIPAEILSKPGRLHDIEYGLIKAHPQVGHDILKAVDFPWPVAEIVLQHHERMDGSGYPAGLSDEKIMLEARILAVADVVEAMASHRPYRPAHGIDKALEEISQNRGVLYDPEVVDACLKVFTEKGFEFE